MPKTICPQCLNKYAHLLAGEYCPRCDVEVVAAPSDGFFGSGEAARAEVGYSTLEATRSAHPSFRRVPERSTEENDNA